MIAFFETWKRQTGAAYMAAIKTDPYVYISPTYILHNGKPELDIEGQGIYLSETDDPCTPRLSGHTALIARTHEKAFYDGIETLATLVAQRLAVLGTPFRFIFYYHPHTKDEQEEQFFFQPINENGQFQILFSIKELDDFIETILEDPTTLISS